MGKLEEYRKEMDLINKDIFRLVLKRISLSKKIGKFKAKNNFSVIDVKREKEIIDYFRKQSVKKNVDPDFVEELFELIMKNSKSVQ